VPDVETLVTLRANEIPSERRSGRCRKRGFADARLPFEKQWTVQAQSEKERNRKPAVCDVVLSGQALLEIRYGKRVGGSH
jgi:hypothetical protein